MEDGDDKDDDDKKDDYNDNNNHNSADVVAQGVSSDLIGATVDAPAPPSVEPATLEALLDPEWRKALHPVVTGSHFHQTRVATDKEEYPRLHEFG